MQSAQGQFAFERLEVYQYSVRFLALASRAAASFPRGHAGLADQLRRAALSVPLNIAEAVGRSGPNDACRQFAIARGSAMECAAIVDACRVLDLLAPEQLTEARSVLLSIVRMLSKLCCRS